MNVLIIEPDKLLGQVIKSAFEMADHNVQLKRTAQSAVDALDENLPDVILLEIQLGKHGGIEYLHELRSHAEWQDIPVIVHTKNQNALNSELTNAWKQAGVKNILYKPQTSTRKLLRAAELAVHL